MAQGKVIYHDSKGKQKELGNVPNSITGNQGLNANDRKGYVAGKVIHQTNNQPVTTPVTKQEVEKNTIGNPLDLIAKGVEMLEQSADTLDAAQNFLLLELHKSIETILGISEAPKNLQEAKKAPVKKAAKASTDIVKNAPIKKRGRKPGSPNKPKE